MAEAKINIIGGMEFCILGLDGNIINAGYKLGDVRDYIHEYIRDNNKSFDMEKIGLNVFIKIIERRLCEDLYWGWYQVASGLFRIHPNPSKGNLDGMLIVGEDVSCSDLCFKNGMKKGGKRGEEKWIK